MSWNLGFMDNYIQEHVAELQREAAQNHLADEAARPRRPIRRRLAYRLYDLAEWLEGQPRFANA
jgi:hypothetical protein